MFTHYRDYDAFGSFELTLVVGSIGHAGLDSYHFCTAEQMSDSWIVTCSMTVWVVCWKSCVNYDVISNAWYTTNNSYSFALSVSIYTYNVYIQYIVNKGVTKNQRPSVWAETCFCVGFPREDNCFVFNNASLQDIFYTSGCVGHMTCDLIYPYTWWMSGCNGWGGLPCWGSSKCMAEGAMAEGAG